MCHRFFAGAWLCCAVVAACSSAVRAGWMFTKIAGSDGPYATISPFAQNLSINENGEVAFSASLDAGRSGIFKGSGGAVTTIIQDDGSALSNSPSSINDSGAVAFVYSGNVYLSSGGSLPPPVYVAGVTGYPPLFGVSVNNAGALAFAAQGSTRAIVTGNGGPLTVVADDAGAFNTFNSRPEINNAGQVAWSTNYDNDATHQSLWRSAGKPSTGIADSVSNVFSFIDEFTMNNLGAVAFGANTSGGGAGIYRGNGGSIVTTIVDSSGPYSTFTDGNLRPKPGLNDHGDVAFWAKLDSPSTVQGIFTGPNPATDAVIETGEALFGSTVTDLAFSGRGFNNTRQIAFVAVLANGTTAVVRADFVPEPTSATLLVLLSFGCAARRARHKAE